MSRHHGRVRTITERVGRKTVKTFVAAGYHIACGSFHSVEAERENQARIGLRESYVFCESEIEAQSNQADEFSPAIAQGVMA